MTCGDDRTCSLPATCCSTLVCRWLCCCCSSCISQTYDPDALNKALIRKECTVSFHDMISMLSTYVPPWVAKLFLYKKNSSINEDSMFSVEEKALLKSEFLEKPNKPWIGIEVVLDLMNMIRIFCVANVEIQASTTPWKHWSLFQRSRNAVESVSKCSFLESHMTEEWLSKILLVCPTGDYDFTTSGEMSKLYSMLCATINENTKVSPGQDLDPTMVLGVLLRIFEQFRIPFTPTQNIEGIAFDCTAGQSFSELSIEMQMKCLKTARRALNSRYLHWWDFFNSIKEEIEEVQDMESSSLLCCSVSPCCTVSPCCGEERGDVVDSRVIVHQPLRTPGTPASPRRGGSLPRDTRPGGIGYGLLHLAGLSGGKHIRVDSDSDSDSDLEEETSH